MENRFFEHPILNSPYEYPARHWELDASGQPTQQTVETRRTAQFITPIPKPRKQKDSPTQQDLELDDGTGLSTRTQRYEPIPIINELRRQVDEWRRLPSPNDWLVTPETARLLQHWRHHEFQSIRPFFCQVEAVETAIWLSEVAPKRPAGKKFLEHLANANAEANPELSRLALKLATGAGKTTVMAMLIAWQTINAVRRPGSTHFTRGFLIVTPGLTIKDRLRVLQPSDPDSYYASRELVPLDMLDDTANAFEEGASDLLAELHTSHLGFFHSSARRASSRAALSASYLADDTPYGMRWIFQNVHSGGAADLAGIQPGNILLRVDGREIVPPEHPVFAMGTQTVIDYVANHDQEKTASVDVARPKGKKLHFIEPALVESRRLNGKVGYLKVAMFPGMVGVVVANRISEAVESLGNIRELIIDLRGNTGGGVGALRVMSLLTPHRIPVGFSLDQRQYKGRVEDDKLAFPRFSRIPQNTKYLWLLGLRFAPAMMAKKPIVLETEGLGQKPFHGRIGLLVDRHTASAAEMIVAFARENNLATIIGEKTAGRLLSATSVKVGKGFRLALPTGVYRTWRGSVFEGNPIEPDIPSEFDWRGRRINDADRQLRRGVEALHDSELKAAQAIE